MPSLDLYKKILGNPRTLGEARKIQSDKILEASWYTDTSAKIAYFYDQEHDEEFSIWDDLHPQKTHKIPVEVKLFEIEYNSLAKDTVAYHLQFKPSFNYKKVIRYYDRVFTNPYKASFPIGMYLDYPDSNDVYHRWLVVDEFRQYSNQFPTYLVLPCDFKLQWIFEEKMLESWGTLRSQSSYNSGIWTSYKFTSPENQKIVWLPMNDVTATLFYDQRVAISEPRKEIVCWKCSKVEDMNVKGITRLTFAQDRFNEHKDYIEKDSDGNVIGMWCNYYLNGDVSPERPVINTFNYYSTISFSGSKPDIKVGGSYKKFTVIFHRDGNVISHVPGIWTFLIDGVDVTDKMNILTDNDSTDVSINQIKVKLKPDNSLIGKKLLVGFESDDGIKSEIEINILGF